MKYRVRSFVLVLLLAVCGRAGAEEIRQYIHASWDSLSRSTNECASVHDVKVTTAPILYLPAGMAEPANVAKMRSACGVEVLHLPRMMRKIGDVRPEELKRPGLLYLPNRYVVPGGRFNEMYGWDSYFIVLGLVQDGRVALARGMVENFFFEIEHYGALLNANRTYYLTRSQPPLLAEMVAEVYEAWAKSDAAAAKAWLAKAVPVLERDHALWTSEAHRAGTTGLSRYFDLGEGPVLEMADDSTYYPDAIKWMLEHKDSTYLVKENASDAESCTRALTSVCVHATFGGKRLSRDFYRGDRAMRESGFDTSFRFGAFSGSTHHFAPVCLNSLLYRYETRLAEFSALLGAPGKNWIARAAARKDAMNQYLWDAATGRFADYDFVAKKRSGYVYATDFYPLWAGLSTVAQSAKIEQELPKLEMEHGLAMSAEKTGMQWDAPYGWAPEQWFGVEGLERAGFHADAVRLAAKFCRTVEANFTRDGTIREKFDAVTGTTDILLTAGYKSNAVGFGWTNGVYVRLVGLK